MVPLPKIQNFDKAMKALTGDYVINFGCMRALDPQRSAIAPTLAHTNTL